MHFKGYVITKEIPTQEKIGEILSSYYYENDKEDLISWDWYEIGGRFGGKIKIHFNPEENEDNWYACQDRNYKYFISTAITELKEKIKPFYDELDWLVYMGLRENILYVDGAYYKDMIDFDITDCYMVIDDEGKLYKQEEWDNEKVQFVKNANFNKELKKLDLTDKFITIIDYHW